MRGEILHTDDIYGIGYVLGEDGRRYRFATGDFREAGSLAAGTRVAFTPDGDTAREINPVAEPPETYSYAPPVSPPIDQPLTFWGYFAACVTTRYANFSGRARRMEFWAFIVFSALVTLAAVVAGFKLGSQLKPSVDLSYGMAIVFAVVCYVALFVPSIAVLTRRVHDIGLSGWFALLFVVLSFFSIGILITLVLGLVPSQRHDNQWGPMPARRQRSSAAPALGAAGA